MSERIFISYRTADGADKATALARDLGEVFGDSAVFLDKDDLPGGSAWRAEINRTLDSRPILLLLVTPQLLASTDANGQPRIASADDPVRRELEEALKARAHIIPVLCDGLGGPPDTATLPPPFNRIGELTWRSLRAYDWSHDVERLVTDLKALGVPVKKAAPNPAPPIRSKRSLLLGSGLAIAVAALALWWLGAPDAPQSIAGRWQAQLWQGEQVVVVLGEKGEAVTLASEPIAIAGRPDWVEYRGFWKEQGNGELNAIFYRGEGKRIDNPGVAPALDIALQVLPSPGGESPIDSGNLSVTLAPDGRTLSGRIWLNGAQADQPAVLTRLR
ncbi:MAG: hypothetical protein H6R13_1550 [Proteobacteria bacterium]|nr:hypothetical protein [Pseudomonadota bacterium]